jgi:exosortase
MLSDSSVEHTSVPGIPSEIEQAQGETVSIPLLIVTALAFLGACWPLFRVLPDTWFGYETYYSHGVAIPFCTAYLISERWPKLRQIPTIGSNWAIIPIVVLFGLLWPTYRSEMHSLMSVEAVALLICGVWFVAGAKWAKVVAVPVMFLLFCLPVWQPIIDRFTQPLQRLSATIAYHMLAMVGQNPTKTGPDQIYLNTYALSVGAPCSGLKTMIAVTALSVFFVLVLKMKTWANVVLLALIIPISLLINGVRIAMIGFAGNEWGDSAGTWWHEYGAYIVLMLGIALLYQITRWLGGKS